MMEMVYTDEILKKKADVCGQLQRAVVQFCEQTYAGITHSNMEVDGIICISFSNSYDQHVVKIHERLGKGREESTARRENHSDCLNTDIDKGNEEKTQSPCRNYNRISDKSVVSASQDDIDVSSYNEQENITIQFDSNRHVERFSDENIEENVAQNETLCEVMENGTKLKKESPQSGAGTNKRKKQFVESVEGNYVIVKVEPEDLDAEEQANLKDNNIVQSCCSQTLKTASFSPKSGSYIRQDSVEKLSVVDDSNDTMYMVTTDFHPSTSCTETYPYQPSINNCKPGDRSSFSQRDSMARSVDSHHMPSTQDVTDLNHHTDVNYDLTEDRYSQDSVVLDPSCTKLTNKKSKRRSSGSIKPNTEDFDPNVFQNFSLPLAPLDPMPVPHPVGLSSTSVGSGFSSDTQSSLSSPYYNYNSNSYSSSFCVSSASSQLLGSKSRLSSSIRPHSNYNNKGRTSALSHAKRATSVVMPRSANFSSKHTKKNQKSLVSSIDSKTHFNCPPSDSFIPSTGNSKYKVGLLDTSQEARAGHDKLFFCRYCGKGFTMKCTRSRHEKTICSPAGAGSYRCELCPKSFTRSDSRYRHMFKAHGVQS
ncbi:uncharacterized protein LOC132553136 [Ylistrum balloti]|uniref:uncharacterized protein LOC132553136 n=1 Tax=Ylistrum balloti TaxID=509963 RepID=UPI002905DCFD|nr:uncharacterized protein LOC132553136 [Ylistrum balloti]